MHKFIHNDHEELITFETEMVSAEDVLDVFKRYLLAVSFHPNTVDRIVFLDKDEE